MYVATIFYIYLDFFYDNYCVQSVINLALGTRGREKLRKQYFGGYGGLLHTEYLTLQRINPYLNNKGLLEVPYSGL